MRLHSNLFIAIAALTAVGACKKDSADKPGESAKPTESAKHTCDDAEAAMRRIDPERTAKMRPGVFAKVCRDSADPFDQARIDCTVAAQSYDDLKVCADPSLRPIQPPAGATDAVAWREVPKFGAKLQVPGNVTVAQRDHDAHLTNGTFKLNVFAVDEHSPTSADEVKASLSKEPGFVKFTKEERGAGTWHFDYELAEGKAGTSARIDVGHPLDCGVHNVPAALAQVASAACASARAL